MARERSTLESNAVSLQEHNDRGAKAFAAARALLVGENAAMEGFNKLVDAAAQQCNKADQGA